MHYVLEKWAKCTGVERTHMDWLAESHGQAGQVGEGAWGRRRQSLKEGEVVKAVEQSGFEQIKVSPLRLWLQPRQSKANNEPLLTWASNSDLGTSL